MTKTTAAPVSRAAADQLGLHPLAGHLVERAERLVHEQQRGPLGERAGDRHPLLHAAGELARAVLGEVAQPDQLEQLPRPLAALRPADAVRAPAAARRSPAPCATAAGRPAGTRSRSPGRAAPRRPSCRTRDRPRWSARRGRATSRSSVLLPQPDGPMSETNSPGRRRGRRRRAPAPRPWPPPNTLPTPVTATRRPPALRGRRRAAALLGRRLTRASARRSAAGPRRARRPHGEDAEQRGAETARERLGRVAGRRLRVLDDQPPDAAARAGRDLRDDRADDGGRGGEPQRRHARTARSPAAAAAPASATTTRRSSAAARPAPRSATAARAARRPRPGRTRGRPR